MTSGQSPDNQSPDTEPTLLADQTPASSPSYTNSRFLGIGVVVVLVAIAAALLISVRASAWWLSAAMAFYALARLVLPESGKYEGLAVRSKFLDVTFLTITAVTFGVLALIAPASM